MSQGSRPERVGDQIRSELATLLVRDVHDPGIGFVTLTRVLVSPDLQLARVFYTTLGDATARGNTARALDRASGFLRRQIGQRLRLRRVPEIRFQYDEAIAGQDRIEQILHEIHAAESPNTQQEAPESGALDTPLSRSDAADRVESDTTPNRSEDSDDPHDDDDRQT